MEYTQTTLDLKTSNTWAFAKVKNRNLLVRRAFKGRGVGARDYIITACSRQARHLGVRVGMGYDKASRLVPDMKVLLIGNRQS